MGKVWTYTILILSDITRMQIPLPGELSTHNAVVMFALTAIIIKVRA